MNPERDLEGLLFKLKRLENEGKEVRVFQEDVWEEIKREIEEGVDKENEQRKLMDTRG